MCGTCFGFGLWAIGFPSPMGRLDALDGCPTVVCPECGMSFNDKNVKKRRLSR